MKVLVACEFSGAVRDAFTAAGHHAVSCDLEPSETEGLHHQGNVMDLLGEGWDLMIAFPPCTYLTKANAWRWSLIEYERVAALQFVWELMNAPIERICIENPAGAIGTHIRPADQYIQPYMFGTAVKKTTGLWLKNLPKLEPGEVVEPEVWHVSSGSNYRMGLASGVRKSKDRSRTFPAIAQAMADQWGQL